MTPQAQIKRAFELLKKAQAQLDSQTRKTRGPNLERVAEFLRAETVMGDRVSAKQFWQRFENWLPDGERYEWNRRAFYHQLRGLGYRVKPGTRNNNMIHGLALVLNERA